MWEKPDAGYDSERTYPIVAPKIPVVFDCANGLLKIQNRPS